MSNVPAVIESDAFDRMEKVAALHIKGTKIDTIAKQLSITRVEAKRAIEQWQEVLNSDQESRDAARDHLNKMVVHFDELIKLSYDNLDNLNSMSFDEKISAQINATLKNISDYEGKRVDVLQRAGLMDAHDLGDELADREAREEALIQILQNDLCPECKSVVARKIQELTGQVQIVAEYEQ